MTDQPDSVSADRFDPRADPLEDPLKELRYLRSWMMDQAGTQPVAWMDWIVAAVAAERERYAKLEARYAMLSESDIDHCETRCEMETTIKTQAAQIAKLEAENATILAKWPWIAQALREEP